MRQKAGFCEPKVPIFAQNFKLSFNLFGAAFALFREVIWNFFNIQQRILY
jgi:hypothetical protein